MKTLDNRSTKTGEPTTETDTDGFAEVLLSPWHEIVGKCIDMHRDDENISLILKVNGQALKVIIPALNQNLLLPQFIGKRIGILRTDDPARHFVVRVI